MSVGLLLPLTGILVLLLALFHMPVSEAFPVTTEQIVPTLPNSNVKQEKNFCDSEVPWIRGRQIRHLIKMGASLTLCEGSASPNTDEQQQQ